MTIVGRNLRVLGPFGHGLNNYVLISYISTLSLVDGTPVLKSPVRFLFETLAPSLGFLKIRNFPESGGESAVS